MTKIGWLISTSGYSAQERDRRLAQLRSHLPADIEPEIVTTANAPEFLDDGGKFGDAVASASGAIGELGYPVIVLAGGIDPGLPDLRKLTGAVVLGCAESSLFLASQLGRNTSIVTVDEHAVNYATGMVKRMPWASIASIRSIDVPVRQIMSGGIEGPGFDRARRNIMREATAAVEQDGADGIYLGAMTLSTLGIADELKAKLGVAVFDPMPIVLSVATRAVRAIERAAA